MFELPLFISSMNKMTGAPSGAISDSQSCEFGHYGQEGVGDQTINHVIRGRPALPPEPLKKDTKPENRLDQTSFFLYFYNRLYLWLIGWY